MNFKFRLGCCLLLVISCGQLLGDEPQTSNERETESHSQATSVPIVDRSTLTGKVMVGYQGWFCSQRSRSCAISLRQPSSREKVS